MLSRFRPCSLVRDRTEHLFSVFWRSFRRSAVTRDGSGFFGLFWILFLGFFRGTFGRGLAVDFEVVLGPFEVFKDFFGGWIRGLGVEGLVFEGLSDFSKWFGVESPF
jgi:hypothetical protein